MTLVGERTTNESNSSCNQWVMFNPMPILKIIFLAPRFIGVSRINRQQGIAYNKLIPI